MLLEILSLPSTSETSSNIARIIVILTRFSVHIKPEATRKNKKGVKKKRFASKNARRDIALAEHSSS